MRLFYIKIIFLFAALIIRAQDNLDSLSFLTANYQNHYFSNLFEKQLNTYQLNSALKYSFSDDNFFIGLGENYRSAVIRLGEKTIKDEQYFSMLGEYNFTSELKSGFLLNSSIFSDDRKLAINEASDFNSSFYVKYSPLERLQIIPFAGFSSNTQIGVMDQGVIYGAEAVADHFSYSNLDIFSSFRFQNEDISPRKNSFRVFNLRLSNDIENSLTNNFITNYSERRRDFYFEADSLTNTIFDVNNNIQSRTESSWNVADRLIFFSMESGFSMDIEGSTGFREIDRSTRYIVTRTSGGVVPDTRIEEFRLDLNSSLRYISASFSGILKIGFSEREEKHFAKKIEELNPLIYEQRKETEAAKNNKNTRATISLRSEWNISADEKLSFSIFHRKLVYDTPSEANNDDRDELLSIFRIYYGKKLTRFFDYFATIQGSLNHIVYIFAERSSNNNLRRVIKLSSGGTFNNKFIVTKNSAEVSANYTVYDFEDINPNYKSFSFRQYVLRDSSVFNLYQEKGILFNGYLKLSEQGDFNWNSFSGSPVRYLQEYYAEPRFFAKLSAIRASVGLRFFQLNRYSFTSDNRREKESTYRSIGPVSEFLYDDNSSIIVRIHGWYEFITTETDAKRETANLFLQINWKI